MQGVITKKDWWAVAKEFGIMKAVKLLTSRKQVALLVLMK